MTTESSNGAVAALKAVKHSTLCLTTLLVVMASVVTNRKFDGATVVRHACAEPLRMPNAAG